MSLNPDVNATITEPRMNKLINTCFALNFMSFSPLTFYLLIAGAPVVSSASSALCRGALSIRCWMNKNAPTFITTSPMLMTCWRGYGGDSGMMSPRNGRSVSDVIAWCLPYRPAFNASMYSRPRNWAASIDTGIRPPFTAMTIKLSKTPAKMTGNPG